MYSIYFYNKEGRWFSTVRILSYFESNESISKRIKTEIEANTKQWPNVIYTIHHNNHDITGWYKREHNL